jgi:tRNA A-37 threonylcarbamoyl transferase component Bud32
VKLEAGAEIGPYRVIERAGSGGMASVYKAYQASLSRYVAIKVLPDYLADDRDFRERFQAEATAVASLRHPNIPAIFDYGMSGDATYLASDYVDGGTLTDQMGRPLPLEYVLRILRPVASALDYAHSRGVLHRDIKPSNILLTREGQPMLNDFGLARMMESEVRVTQAPTVMGTPQYMAPEQCAGEDVGPSADIYSFGVMAYEMLTGRVPYSAPTPAAVMIAQMTEALPPPRSVNPELSEGVERALLKALAKDPKDRFLSASAFLDALAMSPRQDRVDGVSDATRPLPAQPAVPRGKDATARPAATAAPRSRRPLVLAAVALVVVLVVGGGGAYLLTRPGGIAGAGSTGAATTSPKASPTPLWGNWTPGDKMAQATPPVARGRLLWAAALGGGTTDFAKPNQRGSADGSQLTAATGHADIAVLKPDAFLFVSTVSPDQTSYVTETDMAIQPGSHFTARWLYRRGDAGHGSLFIALDSQQNELSYGYLPPGDDATPETNNTITVPELFTGQVFTLTSRTAPDGATLWVNQTELANFNETRGAAASGVAYDTYGQAGAFRILGARVYALH